MFEYNEIITLILGTGCMFFILNKKPQLERLPFAFLLLFSYYFLYTGWLLTVIEDFFWLNIINIIEHICYVFSSALLAFWCWNVVSKKSDSP